MDSINGDGFKIYLLNLARKQLISQFMLSYVFKKIYMISKWCILSGKQQLVIRNFEWNQTTQARTWNWPLPNSEPYAGFFFRKNPAYKLSMPHLR